MQPAAFRITMGSEIFAVIAGTCVRPCVFRYGANGKSFDTAVDYAVHEIVRYRVALQQFCRHRSVKHWRGLYRVLTPQKTTTLY